ncbi:MAG TPA: DUF4350 domain-containing protein [Candidatus Acidoferrales bacterium]|nr:DUF4350 domain-containing protein [Candidatus Acidoferrales bacterium]
MTAYRRNVILGSVALAALLAALIVPSYRRGAASLAHPDPTGPTVYSKSAIGHAAFYRLLAELGIPAEISESGSGVHVAEGDVLVVAEPRTDDATLEEVRAMLTAHVVLLVLPKRGGKADPNKPYWLGADTLLAADEVARVLHLLDAEAVLVRNASLEGLTGSRAMPGSVAIARPQLVRSKRLRPLMAARDGILVGEYRELGRRLVLLSDPDLIANHGLTRADNAVVAVSLIRDLGGSVIFDEFEHGFSPQPFHLLGILFQFPFVLVTVQMALAVALLVWAAAGRFGAARSLAPPLEAGKRSLIDTGARLLVQTKRVPDLTGRYREEMVRDAGRRMRAPRGLDTAGLLVWLSRTPGAPSALPEEAPPQKVWTWRKEFDW